MNLQIVLNSNSFRYQNFYNTNRTTTYVKGNSHKTISRFVQQDFADQRAIAQYTQSVEEKLPIKNNLPCKIVLQS